MQFILSPQSYFGALAVHCSFMIYAACGTIKIARILLEPHHLLSSIICI